MTIGQRIAELRKKHNLSQEALGEELVWVAYTVTFENGPTLSGDSDVSFRYTGTQWEEYHEDF